MTLPELLQLRGVRVRRSRKFNEITVCCPFCPERGHDDDQEYHLGINFSTGEGHCFRCGWASKKYAVRAYLSKLGSSSEEIDDAAGVAETPAPKVIPRLPKEFEKLGPEDKDDPLTGAAWKYLMESRRLSQEQIVRNGVGVCLAGRYAYRIVFPVWFEHKLKGFVARDFTGTAHVRYLNSDGEKGLYHLLPAPQNACPKSVVLSEGIFKALRIERAIKTRSAAMLGNTITEDQIAQILKMGYERVVIWPDFNLPGVNGMLESATRLEEAGLRVFTVYPIPEIEADELAVSAIQMCWGRVQPLDWSLRMKIQSTLAFPV